MDARQLVTNGSVARAVFGVSALLAPDAVSRAMGVPARDVNVNARYVTRLFGARDLALGVATIVVRDDRVRLGRALDFNLANELLDTFALAAEVRGRGRLDGPTLGGLAFNATGLATWVMARSRLGRA